MADPLLDFQSRLLLSIHGIPDGDLRRPEKDGAWSVFDVVAHLADIELLMAWRMRRMLFEDEPDLPRIDQERWLARLHGRDSTADVLEQLWMLRRQNIQLINTLTDDERRRTGIHFRLGRIDMNGLIDNHVAHQEKHFGQIERIKKAHGLEASETSSLAGVTAGRANGEHRSIGPGVRVHELWSEGVRRALQVEIDAGAQWPGLDYHVPGPEEVFIVSGDFDDGAHRYEAGTFLHHPAGTSHSPTSENGCVLFVYYPEG